MTSPFFTRVAALLPAWQRIARNGAMLPCQFICSDAAEEIVESTDIGKRSIFPIVADNVLV
jgi:hypothetical protein